MKPSLATLALSLLALAPPCLAAPYDFVLRGGLVIDGSGAPAITADVAVKDRRIARVGEVPPNSGPELDARGLVVAPGFIDVHTHAEGIVDHPRGENFLRMGVTTLVLGNCGNSVEDVGALFARLEKGGMSPNVATLYGHGTLRRLAMGGSFDREPTEAELDAMRGLVERAMHDGAVGLSTGLVYVPGTFSRTEEIVELARVAAARGGLYATHQRSEGDQIFESLEEVIRVGREADIRVQLSHIKLAGQNNWGRAEEVLARLQQARAEGVQITQDLYAYTASSTRIGQLIPAAAREGGPEALARRLDDPEQKAAIVAQMKTAVARRGGNYAYAVIASYRRDRALEGLSIPEAAKKRRGSDSLDDQIALIFEIERNGGAQGVFHSMSEEDVRVFLRDPHTMIACDSGIRVLGAGMPHPRGYGNNARVLGRYVREARVIGLEEAVRRMSSLPAEVFRFHERGLVREGYWADLTVFDPATVRDHSEFHDPHHFSTGFRLVLVNGEKVVENDSHTGARPGQVLRHTPP